MSEVESLALAVSELIRRMSPQQKIELMRHISWEQSSNRKLLRNRIVVILCIGPGKYTFANGTAFIPNFLRESLPGGLQQ